MAIEFERPLLLLLLPASLGLVVWLWRTSRAYMPPVRRRVSLGLRVALVALLVLVLAGPLMQLRADEMSVAVLVDRSDSITPELRDAEDAWLARALEVKAPQDQVAVVTFGEDATVDRALSADSRAPRLEPASNTRGTRTDIAAALRAGIAALPPTSARRLILLSDGRENVEQAESAASLARAAGVQLLSVPLGESSGPEVLVRQLDVPNHLREGERSSATVQIDSNVDAYATLRLLVDGGLVGTQDVDLVQGPNRLVLPLEPLSSGHHVVRAQVETDSDTLPQNNVAGGLVQVLGPPKVLVVEGTQGEAQFLADALRTSGVQVDVATPSTAPLTAERLRDYASVILANVPATVFGEGQMRALKAYVQSFGGGLVVTGGEQAFGPGGYARTPLEDLLPVRMDLRGRSVSASVALILVIDTSGSMSEGPSGTSKMDLAKAAAIASAEMLGEYDEIGVVAFDDTPRWVLQPAPAADLTAIQSAIGEMQPGGGTDIYPALKTAYDALALLDAKVKHVILLTDGQAPQGDYPTLTAQMRTASISLSTIAIGADADFNLLQRLAGLGNGRYYEGNDPFDLPRLLVKETQQVQRAAIVEEDFRPARVSASPAFEGIDTTNLPRLRGYVATTPKRESSVLLASRQADPVLSEWQLGLGRVVAWTSDVRNRWAAPWLEWPDFARFWGQVVKRTVRPPDDPDRQVSVRTEGGTARIRLDAQTGADASDRRYLNFLPTTATVVDPRGQQQQVQMPQVAPGQYEATVPVEDDGVYQLQVTQTDPSGGTANVASGFVVPYSPEYRAPGTDRPFLERLAQRTGGRIISEPAEAFTHDLPAVGAPRPLWPLLLALVALLLVADVAARRVRFSQREVRAGYLAARRRLGIVDEVPPPRPGRSIQSAPAPQALIPASKAVPPPKRPHTAGVAAAAAASHPNRLLAAKQRAARR